MIRTAVGFDGAPVTRVCLLGLFVWSFVGDFLDAKRLLAMESLSDQLWQMHRFWTHSLVIGSSLALFGNMVLLSYLGRHLERLMGSRRFAAFLIFGLLTAPFFSAGLIFVISFDPYSGTYAGPVEVLFALLGLALARNVVPGGILQLSLVSVFFTFPLGMGVVFRAIVGLFMGWLWVSNRGLMIPLQKRLYSVFDAGA